MISRVKIFVLSGLLSFSVQAAGPSTVAKMDSQFWQTPINTPDNFDNASRASILVYSLILQNMRQLPDDSVKDIIKTKTFNRTSLNKWLDKEIKLSASNYQHAIQNCTNTDWTCIGSFGSTTDLLKKAEATFNKMPLSLIKWHDDFKNFSYFYVVEQMRLAALFPTISSEIDLFNKNEWNGDELEDKQFLLTFDDGPTKTQNNTDNLINVLSANNKNAVFFILGNNLQNRLSQTNIESIKILYTNQCVAIHGWEHKSHAKWDDWEKSIERTQNLLTTIFPAENITNQKTFIPLFRPPYGQRKADSISFFQKQGLQVALWNLDSQDWNNQISSKEIANRTLALMLIKRHGVLLFHDVHPKAEQALPTIFSQLGNVVEWRDCHHLKQK